MGPRRAGFGKEARLTGPDMERVFVRGRKFVRHDLILWLHEGTDGPRMGLSVSRKVGAAVRRNRFKRLLRESFRLNRHRLKAGADIALYPRPGCRWRDLSEAEKSFLELCRKAGILQESA